MYPVLSRVENVKFVLNWVHIQRRWWRWFENFLSWGRSQRVSWELRLSTVIFWWRQDLFFSQTIQLLTQDPICKDKKNIYYRYLRFLVDSYMNFRFIRPCFWYYRSISWYHEEGQKTANRIKNLWRFLSGVPLCLRTCISAQVILLRKFHKVESNKLLSDNDFLPKSLSGYPFHFWRDVIQHVGGLRSELEPFVSFDFLKIERIYVSVIYI